MMGIFVFGLLFGGLMLVDLVCEVWLAKRRHRLTRLDAVRLFFALLFLGQWNPADYGRRDD